MLRVEVFVLLRYSRLRPVWGVMSIQTDRCRFMCVAVSELFCLLSDVADFSQLHNNTLLRSLHRF